MRANSAEITLLLKAWRQGDSAALDRLTPLVYDELHRLARNDMRKERPRHTLQATALVNEVNDELRSQRRSANADGGRRWVQPVRHPDPGYPPLMPAQRPHRSKGTRIACSYSRNDACGSQMRGGNRSNCGGYSSRVRMPVRRPAPRPVGRRFRSESVHQEFAGGDGDAQSTRIRERFAHPK
jgi:hypothetical protein